MSLSRLNKVCELEDFPALASRIRDLHPHFISTHANFPVGFEHRKQWEYAHLLRGAEQLGAVHPDGFALGVAAGQEAPLFALTNSMRMVFATDIYGAGAFAEREAAPSMLADPDALAPIPYNRRRLVVQYMDALDLRYEADTFDLVFSLSSIEHFGGAENAAKGIEQMARVCKPGGVVAVATECIVNGAPPADTPGLYLFTPAELTVLAQSVPSLELVDEPSFEVSEATRQGVRSYEKVVEDLGRGHIDFPHLLLELDGRWFTSIMLFFRKRMAHV